MYVPAARLPQFGALGVPAQVTLLLATLVSPHLTVGGTILAPTVADVGKAVVQVRELPLPPPELLLCELDPALELLLALELLGVGGAALELLGGGGGGSLELLWITA